MKESSLLSWSICSSEGRGLASFFQLQKRRKCSFSLSESASSYIYQEITSTWVWTSCVSFCWVWMKKTNKSRLTWKRDEIENRAVCVVWKQERVQHSPFRRLHIFNQILEFPQPKSWEGNVSVMSHVRRSVPDVVSGVCERDCSLPGSPGPDPPAVTCRTCSCTSVNTCCSRRQSRSLTHSRPVAVVQTLKWQNKRKGKVPKGLRNHILTGWVATSQKPRWWRDGARMSARGRTQQSSTWEGEREHETHQTQREGEKWVIFTHQD